VLVRGVPGRPFTSADRLNRAARDFGPRGFDAIYGHGLID